MSFTPYSTLSLEQRIVIEEHETREYPIYIAISGYSTTLESGHIESQHHRIFTSSIQFTSITCNQSNNNRAINIAPPLCLLDKRTELGLFPTLLSGMVVPLAFASISHSHSRT